MMSNTALKSVSSLSAHASSSLLLRRAGRKISSRSRKSTTFYKTTTTKAFASSEGGEGKEEEEWAAMGSNAKSNVVPRRPQLSATNAPEYMHGVLAFDRFYPENARGDTFNRHLLVALVSFFFVLDTFLFALFFSWTSTKTTMQSSAMMEKNIAWLL